ncbi:hypothetical protein F5Y12DRAFT_77559 [Xylaria sp. FL1777]|nr:hypothetical protein F5Y12DRAFT_77559 [Xylaria sp. FL1777]
MKFTTHLVSMANVAMATAYDVSHLVNGIYKIPISDTGIIEYANAVNLNMTYLKAPSEGPTLNSLGPAGLHDTDENEDELQEHHHGHCHWHYPHHYNRFIMGHAMMNMTNYPLTLAMFMEWVSTGAESGWLNRGEVRMAKSNDIVVGACIYKKHRLKTCTHELSLAMGAADRECAGGKVGCHVCLRHWHKDYFRFNASEAPNQCECAWYYW